MFEAILGWAKKRRGERKRKRVREGGGGQRGGENCISMIFVLLLYFDRAFINSSEIYYFSMY